MFSRNSWEVTLSSHISSQLNHSALKSGAEVSIGFRSQKFWRLGAMCKVDLSSFSGISVKTILILARPRVQVQTSLQLRLKTCFISMWPITSQEHRTTGAMHLPSIGNWWFCNEPLKDLLIQDITFVNIVTNTLISRVRLPKLKNLPILLSIKIEALGDEFLFTKIWNLIPFWVDLAHIR